jgi:2-polyprenyl-3-methyl-5-hydroxy-6-metoxy-1,4-benzoquinol methylase
MNNGNNDNVNNADGYIDGYAEMKRAVSRFGETVRCESRWYGSRRWLLEELRDGMRVLDYGCCEGTHGSLGAVHYNGKTFAVEGLDIDKRNTRALYHSPDEVAGRYDAIVLSHVVEHCTPDVVRQILKWCSDHSDRLYVVTPNAGLNPFVDFWCDVQHVRPYNTGTFLYWLHLLGYDLRVVWAGPPTGSMINKLYSTLDAVLRGTSPYREYCVACKRR